MPSRVENYCCVWFIKKHSISDSMLMQDPGRNILWTEAWAKIALCLSVVYFWNIYCKKKTQLNVTFEKDEITKD